METSPGSRTRRTSRVGDLPAQHVRGIARRGRVTWQASESSTSRADPPTQNHTPPGPPPSPAIKRPPSRCSLSTSSHFLSLSLHSFFFVLQQEEKDCPFSLSSLPLLSLASKSPAAHFSPLPNPPSFFPSESAPAIAPLAAGFRVAEVSVPASPLLPSPNRVNSRVSVSVAISLGRGGRVRRGRF